jgi:hypothetical protein
LPVWLCIDHIVNGVMGAAGPFPFAEFVWATAVPIPIASAVAATIIVFISIDLLIVGSDRYMWSMPAGLDYRSVTKLLNHDELEGLERRRTGKRRATVHVRKASDQEANHQHHQVADRDQFEFALPVQCGTDRTDFVVTSRDNPQPW